MGECIPVVSDAIPVGSAGLWTSSVLDANGDLLIAVHDQDVGSLSLHTYIGEEQKRVSHVDGNRIAAEFAWVGEYPDMVRGTDNQLRIAHYDRTHGALKLAVGLGSAWSHQIVDDGGTSGLDVGKWLALAIDGDNGLHFSYRDDTTRRLRVRSLASNGCGVAGSEPSLGPLVVPPPLGRPVSKEDYGQWSSVGIAGDGMLVLSYYDAARGNLVLATCLDDTLNQQVLDGEDVATGVDTGDVGLWSSLAIDPEGSAGIAYFDRTRGVLKYARSEQGVLQIEVVDAGLPASDGGSERRWVGQHASLTYHGSGQPRIAYMDATSRAVLLARRTPFGQWNRQLVDSVSSSVSMGGIGSGLDLIIDEDDAAHLSYGYWQSEDIIQWELKVRMVDGQGRAP